MLIIAYARNLPSRNYSCRRQGLSEASGSGRVDGGFSRLIHLRRGEGGIGTEVTPQLPVPVSVNDRLQHPTPAIGGVHVAGTQATPFKIAELVEHEQRMVTGAAKVTIVDRALLIAMGRADVLSMSRMIIFGGRRSCTRSIQTPDRAVNAARLSSVASHSVSNRPIWLVEATSASGCSEGSGTKASRPWCTTRAPCTFSRPSRGSALAPARCP